jgi:hypothetical protein
MVAATGTDEVQGDVTIIGLERPSRRMGESLPDGQQPQRSDFRLRIQLTFEKISRSIRQSTRKAVSTELLRMGLILSGQVLLLRAKSTLVHPLILTTSLPELTPLIEEDINLRF